MGHVPHVFVPPPWPDGYLTLGPRPDHHLRKVLRRRPGDPVSYTDGAGIVGHGRLTERGIERGDETEEVMAGPEVTIAAAPPSRAERARFLVEKLAELGVDHLVWLTTTHGEGRVPAADKAAAWAIAALEQSRGVRLMSVSGPARIGDLPGLLWVADTAGDAPVPVGESVTVAVGPEGGFAAGEVPAWARPVALGRRVLRVETAAVAAGLLGLQATGRFPAPFGSNPT